MSQSDTAAQAFNIGANISTIEAYALIISLVMAALFLVVAFIMMKLYEELKAGGITVAKLFMVLLRVFLIVLILGYVLLH